MEKKLRICIAGTRGIPASYGGFETFAEELSQRLVQRGHSVLVFGRHAFGAAPGALQPLSGVERRSSPTIRNKYLETPLAALTSFLMLLRDRVDVVLLCNAANSPFAWVLRFAGIPLAINVDGIERKRKKWSALGRLWYRIGERCSVWFASRVVADADVIATYYREVYANSPTIISYGAEERKVAPGPLHAEFGLMAGGYLLYVSRLEPENNALGVIQGYVRSGLTVPLVIVGDAPYADRYRESLRAAAVGANVIFTGYRFGDSYRELRTNCGLYIQATEVGGTHPALIEAMAHGNCVLANDVPEHREVLGSCGDFYRYNDFEHLAERINVLWSDPVERIRFGNAARNRAAELYSWEVVTTQYEKLLAELVG